MLKVNGLSKEYTSGLLRKETVQAVCDVSFSVAPNEVFGIVGESGNGKSTIAQCIIRLTEPTKGSILFHGKDICKMKLGELRKTRRKIQMIFQDPDSALDPHMTIGESLAETLKIQGKTECLEESIFRMIALAGLNREHVNRYPHQLSGGQNQRVVLVRALSFDPELLIADEATASLDVSVQAQILAQLKAIQKERHFAMLFISHDMEIVKRVCSSVMVMYRGKTVEKGPIRLRRKMEVQREMPLQNLSIR